ncbi:vanadium-dependent haloperoxidase [Flavisolibacter ginsenosidimutans]|uniref:Vanadium-dependent haloperoxidase n=1 Tax=Flavisolibacter ginsenosidimutans TaxID=661481 RepID=A0A5B8UFX4_9BACT|nr:vanadium-dependent haloperoxidase [Flavisolibacter ginsenosidimutans]QEC55494.1 vanadium-dependent haloperoxidase [Flavisolibacter ginsenosidimutans]
MKKFFVLLCAVSLFACKHKSGDYAKYTSDPLLYSKTVKRLNDVVLYNNFSPVVASRNYAYANIAAYECIVAGDSAYQSLSGQIKHLPQMPKSDKSKTIDYHLAALLSFVKVGNAVTFPEGVLMDYYDELKNGADSAGMPSDVLKNTVAFSDTIVATVMKWSKGDNYAKTRSAEKFTVRQEDGRWIPTPPMYAQGMEPHWCDIRPLALDSCSQFLPPAPPTYNMKDSNSAYCKELMEIKRTVENLTNEQKQIADFFDDNPFNLHVTGHVMYATKKFSPPGHWMNIVGIAAQKSGADFDKTVAAYTETSIALFDGFIACWKAKYLHNTVRPETVINKLLDPAWQPYIQTPPFPSYVSGHSVISSASAEVMSHYFGDNFSYRDSSEREFGIPDRSFKSFRDAAQEASWSRLYGGIHFRSDLEQGNLVGKKIGEYIVGKLRIQTNSQNQLSLNK